MHAFNVCTMYMYIPDACVCTLHVLPIVNHAAKTVGRRHLFDMVSFPFNVFSEMEVLGHSVFNF